MDNDCFIKTQWRCAGLKVLGSTIVTRSIFAISMEFRSSSKNNILWGMVSGVLWFVDWHVVRHVVSNVVCCGWWCGAGSTRLSCVHAGVQALYNLLTCHAKVPQKTVCRKCHSRVSNFCKANCLASALHVCVLGVKAVLPVNSWLLVKFGTMTHVSCRETPICQEARVYRPGVSRSHPVVVAAPS